MGQDLYCLAKFSSKATAAKFEKDHPFNGDGEPYCVKGISSPAILITTGIDANSLVGSSDELIYRLLAIISAPLIKKIADPKGVLLFADGGEPRKEWPEKISYEKLAFEITNGKVRDPRLSSPFFQWLKFSEEFVKENDHKNPVSIDDFLSDLDAQTLLMVVQAKKQNDISKIVSLLRKAYGKKYDQKEKAIIQWLAPLNK